MEEYLLVTEVSEFAGPKDECGDIGESAMPALVQKLPSEMVEAEATVRLHRVAMVLGC
jgi:hypothetical protein